MIERVAYQSILCIIECALNRLDINRLAGSALGVVTSQRR